MSSLNSCSGIPSAGEKYIFSICSALSVFLLIQICQSYLLGALGRLTASLEILSICGVMQSFLSLGARPSLQRDINHNTRLFRLS